MMKYYIEHMELLRVKYIHSEGTKKFKLDP